MAQFPIVTQTGLYEAVNYLASGPAGLGQNFSGFSAYKPAYLSGTFRAPFTVAISTTTTAPSWYVAPIAINNVTPLNVVNGKTPNLQWTFTTPQAKPPFAVGQTIRGNSAWVPDFYQGNDGAVVSCSTTSVITQYTEPLAWPTPITSYGSIYVSNDGIAVSTDANARVTVTGPTELVFISSQLTLNFDVAVTSATSMTALVQINRYVGSIDTAGQGAVDYLFNLDETVSEQSKTFALTTGTTSVDAGQFIFTTVLDQPSFGYYWYICEVTLTSDNTSYANATDVTVGLRSLTAQVIKQ
jgi:hypothetical protein